MVSPRGEPNSEKRANTKRRQHPRERAGRIVNAVRGAHPFLRDPRAEYVLHRWHEAALREPQRTEAHAELQG